MIVVESKKKSIESILLDYPDATILDVTDQADGGWVKLCPLYPHGDIPVPFSPGYTAETVEGIWQGLKVFEHEGVSLKVMHIMGMTGIKRTGKKLGAYLGHQKGMESDELLDEVEARKLIYDHVLNNIDEKIIFNDAKTTLQEMVQEKHYHVTYELISESGPDHEKTFEVKCYMNSLSGASGTGRSKKQAEQNAASETIKMIRNREICI